MSSGRAAGVQVGSGDLQVNKFVAGLTRTNHGVTPLASVSEAAGFRDRGHVFLSYVREDSGDVDKLQRMLEAAEIPVWRDTASLWPGDDWRVRIQDAITRDALVFIACFSRHSAARRTSYQNEELLLAIDQLRLRPPDDPWLIPVRFDNCEVPDFELGAGRTPPGTSFTETAIAGRGETARTCAHMTAKSLAVLPGPSDGNDTADDIEHPQLDLRHAAARRSCVD